MYRAPTRALMTSSLTSLMQHHGSMIRLTSHCMCVAWYRDTAARRAPRGSRPQNSDRVCGELRSRCEVSAGVARCATLPLMVRSWFVSRVRTCSSHQTPINCVPPAHDRGAFQTTLSYFLKRGFSSRLY